MIAARARRRRVVCPVGRLGAAALLSMSVSVTLAVEATAEAPKTVAPVDVSGYPRLRPVARRPALPVRVVPPDVVEPRRDVPASAWRSPYCVKWTDGVEECGRKAATETATCRRLDGDQPRHPVACLAGDGKRMNEICFELLASAPRRPERPRDSAYGRMEWFWDRNQRAWQALENPDNPHGNLASFFAARGRSEPIPSSFTVFCLAPYSKAVPVLLK